MFRISFSPQFSDQALKIEKRGSVLTIGDKSCDFSQLANGSDVPVEAIDNDYVISTITKNNGIVNITILMPYSDADAPERVRFPLPIMLVEDCEITFNQKAAVDD